MTQPLNIIQDPKQLRKAMLEEAERSEKAQEYFEPIYVSVDTVVDFVNQYKPEATVNGTNEGYVFKYKGKVYDAVSTGRLITNPDGQAYFIYKLDKTNDFNIALTYINEKRSEIRKEVERDSRFKEYDTFEQHWEKKKNSQSASEARYSFSGRESKRMRA